jgi:hypothetical protein
MTRKRPRAAWISESVTFGKSAEGSREERASSNLLTVPSSGFWFVRRAAFPPRLGNGLSSTWTCVKCSPASGSFRCGRRQACFPERADRERCGAKCCKLRHFRPTRPTNCFSNFPHCRAGLNPISHEIAPHRRKPVRRLANIAAISSIPPTVPDLTWRRRGLPRGPAAQIGAGDQPAAGCHEAQNAGGDDDQLTCCGQQLDSQPRS